MQKYGRPWHTLAHALWVVALAASAGCDEANDDSSHGGGDRTDARVVDGGRDDDDAGATGRIDSSAGGDTKDRAIWDDDSVAIDFTLRGPVGQVVCAFSATRDVLTSDQIEGLSSLELHDAQLRAGCDIDNYVITVHSRGGSSRNFRATRPECASQPIVLFEDFDAWASSTPCSSQSR